MYKVLSSFLIAIITVVGMPVAASAASNQVQNVQHVTGRVTDSAGKGIAGANVQATCGSTTHTGLTNGGGNYNIDFTRAECPEGSSVYVTSSQGNGSGAGTTTVGNGTTKVNIETVSVALPEFGLITGAAAVAVASGAFFVIRRRQVGQN